MEKGSLEALTKETVAIISQWEYEAPYEAYSFFDKAALNAALKELREVDKLIFDAYTKS